MFFNPIAQATALVNQFSQLPLLIATPQFGTKKHHLLGKTPSYTSVDKLNFSNCHRQSVYNLWEEKKGFMDYNGWENRMNSIINFLDDSYN